MEIDLPDTQMIESMRHIILFDRSMFSWLIDQVKREVSN